MPKRSQYQMTSNTKVTKKYKIAECKKFKERPLHEDTEFLVSIWHGRGDSVIEIAYILQRPIKQIERILADAKESGMYEYHNKLHKIYVQDSESGYFKYEKTYQGRIMYHNNMI
ncbi:MAG: hypothetical protein KBS62_00245 [Oscillospiraceae bacterium]|nr:hypothetical protein [Candidatus Ruminococcus equi]